MTKIPDTSDMGSRGNLEKIFFRLLFLVLFFTPIFLVYFSIDQYVDDREKEIRFRIRDKLQRSLERLGRFRAGEYYFHLLLKKSFDLAERSEKPMKTIRGEISRLKKRFPRKIRFVVWDDGEKVVDDLTDIIGFRYVLKQIYIALKAATKACRENPEIRSLQEHPEIKDRLAMIATILGKSMLADQLLVPIRPASPRIMWVSEIPEKAYCWYRAKKKITVLCQIHEDLVTTEIGLKTVIKAVLAQKKDFAFGYQNLYYGNEMFCPGAQAFEKELFTNVPLLDQIKENWMESENLLIVQKFPEPGLRLIAVVAKSRYLRTLGFQKIVLTFLIFLALSPGFWGLIIVFFPRRNRFVSVRWKVSVLFFFATGIPLLLLGFQMISYLKELQATRINQNRQVLENHLQNFDDGLKQFDLVLSEKLKEEQEKLKPSRLFELNSRQIDFLMLIGQRMGVSDMSINSADEKIFRTYSDWKGLTPVVSRYVLKEGGNLFLKRVNGEKITSPKNLPVVPQSQVVERTFQKGMKTWAGKDGRISQFSLGLDKGKGGIIGIKNFKSKKTDFAILLFWHQKAFQKLYWEKLVIGAAEKSKDFFTCAWDHASSEFISRNRLSAREAKEFLREGENSIGKFSQVLKIAGQDYLAVGLNGRQMKDFKLGIFLPLEPIYSSVGQLWRRFVLLAILVLALVIILSALLGKTLLDPAGAFLTGARMIQKRKFSHRLPDLGKDEFGQLGVTLNSVFEGLQDLEIARMVQENLFPPNSYSHGNLLAYGKTVSMMELGGDLFDFCPVPGENRTGVLIGDVAGHGVSAALVMVAVKTALEMNSALLSQPEELLKSIHGILFRLTGIRAKKMVTAGFLLVDSKTFTWQYSSAGSPYPVYVQAGGKSAKFVETVGQPLGVVKKARIGSSSLAAKPGDAIILYSDGLVEVSNERDGQLGFPKLLEIAQRGWDPNPETYYENIRKEFDSFRGTREVQDDLTIIVVCFQEEMIS